MNRVLITGGTGSFGQAFTTHVLAHRIAQTVCIFSRGEHRQADMCRIYQNDERLRFFIGDVRDRDRLRLAMEGCDVVIHAAALKRIEVGHYAPLEMVKTNVNGAANVIEAAKDAGVAKVLMLSTDKAFQPVSAYGQSKAIAERMMLAANNMYGEHGPRFAVCRYGNIAGSAGSVIPLWRDVLRLSDTVRATDPDATRFWMTLAQAVDLVLTTIEGMRGGELAIPQLRAYRLGDLAMAMGAKMAIDGLGEWEKKHESLQEGQCSADAPRMSVEELREALRYV